MTRIMGKTHGHDSDHEQTLTFEKMQTILCEIEAILNSRTSYR